MRSTGDQQPTASFLACYTLLSMDASSDIVSVLHRLVKLIVTDPDEVTVEPLLESAKLVVRLRVAPRDLGKVIGKQGKTARALRQILEAAGMAHKMRIILDIDESQAQMLRAINNKAPV